MSTVKRLFIPLKTEYYRQFEAGTKTKELRLYGPQWNERTCVVGRPVTIALGYGKKHRMSGVVAGFEKVWAYNLDEQSRAAVKAVYYTLDKEMAVITLADLTPGDITT